MNIPPKCCFQFKLLNKLTSIIPHVHSSTELKLLTCTFLFENWTDRTEQRSVFCQRHFLLKMECGDSVRVQWPTRLPWNDFQTYKWKYWDFLLRLYFCLLISAMTVLLFFHLLKSDASKFRTEKSLFNYTFIKPVSVQCDLHAHILKVWERTSNWTKH